MDDGHDGKPAEKGKRNDAENKSEDIFVFGRSNETNQ
jgi:hypothetical protein